MISPFLLYPTYATTAWLSRKLGKCSGDRTSFYSTPTTYPNHAMEYSTYSCWTNYDNFTDERC